MDAARVVLAGAESTGKTTLAAALAGRLGTIWVPEYAREYAEARSGVLTAADVEPIARGQQEAERKALAETPGPVVFDTDLLSTAVYARHYYGITVPWIEAAIAGYPRSLYLLCDLDLGWTADPVRDRAEARAVIQGKFAAALAGREVAIVSGSGEARLERALAAVGAAS